MAAIWIIAELPKSSHREFKISRLKPTVVKVNARGTSNRTFNEQWPLIFSLTQEKTYISSQSLIHKELSRIVRFVSYLAKLSQF
jgi:hypothetical protein